MPDRQIREQAFSASGGAAPPAAHAPECEGRALLPLRVPQLTAADYHADPCERPSLSSSIAHILCTSSPRHAWTQHPRLNPNFARVDDDKFDIGTTAHALLLEGNANVVVVPADDWRTKAAKEAREAAREAGMTALLEKQWIEVQAMVAAMREQLDAHEATPTPFTDGKAEQTIVWEEDNGVVCRARPDWLRDDLTAVDDYKTAYDAHPEHWPKKALLNNGYDVQCAFYIRGIERLTGERPEWRWIVQEKTPPYVVTIVSPGADVLAVAEAKVEWAIARWARCLAADDWPAYSRKVVTAELPAWADDAKWLVDEFRSAA